MNNTDLPALPPQEAIGPDVCTIMRLYMAISRDLPAEQVRVISAHVRICKKCTREHHIFSRTTRMVAGVDASTPSARVDQVVMAAIAARSKNRVPTTQISQAIRPLVLPRRQKRKSPVPMAALLATAAVLVVAVVASLSFAFQTHPAKAFAIPGDVTWNSSVLYHTQTIKNADGEPYHVGTYDYLAKNIMHVETTLKGKDGNMQMDVIVVNNKGTHQAIGMNMMNDVYQLNGNAQGWVAQGSAYESMFDLKGLRDALQAKQATYQGIYQFQGQKFYRIQCPNGLFMLLNMQYQPVNILQGDQPIYQTLNWVAPANVPAGMWDMNPPNGFTAGALPQKP